MPKEFLNLIEGHTFLNQPSRKRVPETMEMESVVELETTNVSLEGFGYFVLFELPTPAMEKVLHSIGIIT